MSSKPQFVLHSAPSIPLNTDGIGGGINSTYKTDIPTVSRYSPTHTGGPGSLPINYEPQRLITIVSCPTSTTLPENDICKQSSG